MDAMDWIGMLKWFICHTCIIRFLTSSNLSSIEGLILTRTQERYYREYSVLFFISTGCRIGYGCHGFAHGPFIDRLRLFRDGLEY